MKDERLIGKEIQQVANQFRRHMDYHILRQYDMTNLQGMIMHYLYDHANERGTFQKDLEKFFDFRSSTLTNVLKLMEQKGLIKRVNVAEDARLKKIVLTEKSVHIQERVTRAIMEMEERLEKNLSKEEIDLFFHVLERISQSIPKKDLDC